MSKIRLFSWFQQQPKVIRATIIGAMLAGGFAILAATMPALLDITQNRPKIIASIMDFGRLRRYTIDQIETIDCEISIRLHNVGRTSITLDHVVANARIGDKKLPTVWRNEYTGSGNILDEVVYYFDIISDFSPISISAHSATDVKVVFSIDADINQYQFIENLNDLDTLVHEPQKISVSYIFVFPGKISASTDEIFCAYIIDK
jgi:hypothetical protein